MVHATQTARLFALRSRSIEDVASDPKGPGRSDLYKALGGNTTVTPWFVDRLADALSVSKDLVLEVLAEDRVECRDQRVHCNRIASSHVTPYIRTAGRRPMGIPTTPTVREPAYRLSGQRLTIRAIDTAVAVGSHVSYQGVDFVVLYCGEDAQGYLVRARKVTP
jgi:hypothetical protein